MQIPEQSQLKYLARRHQDWLDASEAMKQGNLKILETLGHKWKGNGSTFGFPELGELGSKLEVAASTKAVEQVEKLLSEFRAWLNAHPAPAQ